MDWGRCTSATIKECIGEDPRMTLAFLPTDIYSIDKLPLVAFALLLFLAWKGALRLCKASGPIDLFYYFFYGFKVLVTAESLAVFMLSCATGAALVKYAGFDGVAYNILASVFILVLMRLRKQFAEFFSAAVLGLGLSTVLAVWVPPIPETLRTEHLIGVVLVVLLMLSLMSYSGFLFFLAKRGISFSKSKAWFMERETDRIKRKFGDYTKLYQEVQQGKLRALKDNKDRADKAYNDVSQTSTVSLGPPKKGPNKQLDKKPSNEQPAAPKPLKPADAPKPGVPDQAKFKVENGVFLYQLRTSIPGANPWISRVQKINGTYWGFTPKEKKAYTMDEADFKEFNNLQGPNLRIKQESGLVVPVPITGSPDQTLRGRSGSSPSGSASTPINLINPANANADATANADADATANADAPS